MSYLVIAAGALGVPVAALAILGRSAMTTIYNSIKPHSPSSSEQDHEPEGSSRGDGDSGSESEHKQKQSHPLFEFLPGLSDKIAWLDLGTYPTPISEARLTLPHNDMVVKIYLKREGLSSPLYGGNKVRTLEFLLASALEQARDYNAKHPEGQLGRLCVG
jgi:hypothetical protein